MNNINYIIWNYYNNQQILNMNKTTQEQSYSYEDYDPSQQTATLSQQTQQTAQNQQIPLIEYSSSDDSSDGEYDRLPRVRDKTGKQYHINTYTKLDSKLSLNMINQVYACEAKELTKQPRHKDKSQRATVQQVLDPRTRLILLKLLSNGTFSEINGCLSTGKQANVYHAKDDKGKQFAIKIYKTSILIFKDRQRYVEGEFRFRKGHSAKNPRKMVQMWAEKELRNLKRIQGKIPCPNPLLVKTNVLVMDFIGNQMKAAPKLKDVEASLEQYSNMYLQIILDMRILYQECRLTHADLSEYNLLYYEKKIYMIDVSQAVENDHPHSLQFLRRDIVNINDFFKKKGVSVFSVKQVFNFIVSLFIKKENQKAELEKLCDDEDLDENDPSFAQIHIPRTLEQLSLEKIEKDLQNPQNLHYHTVTGVINNQTSIPQQQNESGEQEEQSSQSDSQYTQNNTNVQGDQSKIEQLEKIRRGGQQKYDGLTKLQRKHKVKQDKREKRKDKIPKKQKKQKTKKAK